MIKQIRQIYQIQSLFDRKDKLRYFGLLVMMIVGAVLDVVGIGAIPAFVASLAMPEKVFAFPVVGDLLNNLGIQTSKGLVLWGSVGLIIIFICKNMYLYLVYSLQVRITEYHKVRLATRLFTVYMYAGWEFHLQKNSAELLRNVLGETREIITGIINPLLNLTMGSMMTLLTIVLLLVSTPNVAVAGIGMIGGASWLFLRIFNKKLLTYGEIAKKERKEMLKAVNQGFAGLLAARILGRESYFISVLQKSVGSFARVTRLRQVISKASPNMLEMVAVSGLMCIVIFLVSIGNEPANLVPMLALYGAAIARLRQSIAQIVGSIGQIQFSKAAIPTVVEDMGELGKLSMVNKSLLENKAALSFEEAIQVNDLTYTYPEAHKPALSDINLTIRKGESVAFVGETGSGKSTLINLLLGLMRPEEGEITVDNMDIHSNMAGWLRHVGYIPQNIELLDDTVRRNVAYGLDDSQIQEEQVWQAIEAAQLGEYIRSLPDGLDTMVGERGVRFSGGQVQRVGLARALYTNPDIIVMDEATSALDNRTESYVMKTLEELKEGRTFIIIAHRLSTVSQCDRLYLLKDGKIDVSGSYDDLNRSSEAFQRLVEAA